MTDPTTALNRDPGHRAGMPLSAHPALRSADMDQTREWMEGFSNRSVKISQQHRSRAGMAQNSAGIRSVAITYESLVASTRFDVARYDVDPFVVFIPTAGRLATRLGTRESVATPDVATVLSPAGQVSLLYGAGTQGFQIRIDREFGQARLRKMLGGVTPKSFEFDMAMDLGTAAARSWRALVDVAIADLDAGGGIASSTLAAASLENAIVDALLVAQHHNFSDKLEQAGPTARPRTIQRAVNLIHDHCHEPLSTADIAEAVGLSARSLQEGFRTHVGTTPMAYLRRARLHRIRDELRVANPATTNVTRIALDWGMPHLGRFAQSYRAEFGESPSKTLRLGS
jgi:AraC-like DNA-binding protein